MLVVKHSEGPNCMCGKEQLGFFKVQTDIVFMDLAAYRDTDLVLNCASLCSCKKLHKFKAHISKTAAPIMELTNRV